MQDGLRRATAGPGFSDTTAANSAGNQAFAAVIALNQWGTVLLTRRQPDEELWQLPGGPVPPGQAPDTTALNAFEEQTGHLLDELRLFGIFPAPPDETGPRIDRWHVYYCDPDLDLRVIGAAGHLEFRYFSSEEIDLARMAPMTGEVIKPFFQSTHYRAMFH